MLDLKDFFHLPEVDVLLAQVVGDPRGITVVAGLGPRSAQTTASGVGEASGSPSNRPTLAALLMRHILDRGINGRAIQAAVVGPSRTALAVAQHQRRQVQFVQAPMDHVDGFTTGLQQAMMGDPDLLSIDLLTTVTAPAVFHAAATGRRILAQIDTAVISGGVLQEIVGLGCSPSQMSLVAWVVGVRGVPTLCTYCKQPHQPGAALVATMVERHGIDSASTFYTTSGCRQCAGTGYVGELAAFDIFRVHGGVTSFSELVSTPSLLPLEGYLARLAAHGYLPLEDAARLGQWAAGRAAPALPLREAPVDVSSRSLQRRLAEVEAANKVLAQRIDELISLQEVGHKIHAETHPPGVASRLAQAACELSGADRAIVYHTTPDGDARVLAAIGWGVDFVGRRARLPVSMLERGDPESVVGAPPGIDVPPDQVQAGMRVPLVDGDELIGVLVAHSSYRARFAPGRVAMLKTLGEIGAEEMRRALAIEALQSRLAGLEASRADLVDGAQRERDREAAREIHLRGLPTDFPRIPSVHLAAAYRPAPDINCDLYDVIDLRGDRLAVLMADVEGRGLGAAHGMALARVLIRAEARRSESPRAVLNYADRALREAGPDGVMLSAILGFYDIADRHWVYCRAGHARPLWMRGDGQDVLLSASGAAIGSAALGEPDLAEGEIFLSPGDALILYSKGLIDTIDSLGSEFGAAHFVKRARDHFDLPADQLCNALVDEVAAFQAGTVPSGDIALLVMKVDDRAAMSQGE